MRLILNHKRLFLTLVISLTLIATAGFLFWNRQASAEQFTTARVTRGDIRKTVSATGTLEAVTTVEVSSQASGTISALFADFNSTIKKGQILAQLDPAVFQAQLAQARANLEQAQAAFVDAQARVLAAQSTVKNQRAGVSSANANVEALRAQKDDAQRFLNQQESLVTGGVIPRRELETAQASYKSAEARYNQAIAQVEQARAGEQSSATAGLAQAKAQVQQAQAQIQQSRAALNLAEVNLSHTTIRSPIDGIVVSRNVDVGQTVAASLSAPTLFTLANDLTQMQVIANIDQADIGIIDQTNKINFTVDAFPGETFSGQIEQIRLNPQNVQNVVTYNVVINVENPELKLKPGMTANLTITISEKRNVTRVPNAALRFKPSNSDSSRRQERTSGNQDQSRTIYILGADKKPQPRRVKTGITDGATTEVVEGDLKQGDLVIVGQNISGESSRQNRQQTPPGFGGGMPRGGGGGMRRM